MTYTYPKDIDAFKNKCFAVADTFSYDEHRKEWCVQFLISIFPIHEKMSDDDIYGWIDSIGNWKHTRACEE